MDQDMLSRAVDIAQSDGVFEDFWLDRFSVLALNGSFRPGAALQLWIPREAAGPVEGIPGKLAWRIGEEDHLVDVPTDTDLISIPLPKHDKINALPIWIGTSFWSVLFDRGENKDGRRVSVKLHALCGAVDGAVARSEPTRFWRR
ncbi:MAG: hypothetical protein ACFB6R_18550 [Alphaproteobacteria bacterium]